MKLNIDLKWNYMIKKLIYRIIKYLFKIDIKELLSSIQLLQSNSISLKQKNEELEQQLDILNNSLQRKENLHIAENNELENLKTENTVIKLDNTQVLSILKALQLKYDENEHLTQQLTTENKRLNEKLQSEVNNGLATQSLLKNIESEYLNQNNTIIILHEQIASNKESESKQLELIRNLKQVVSQLQSEEVNSKCKVAIIENLQKSEELKLKNKKELIENLQKNVYDRNEQIRNLQSEIEELYKKQGQSTPPVITHSPQPSTKTLQVIDGVVIEHKGLNVGKRSEKSFENEDNKFDYLGQFLFNLRQYNKKDSDNFPDVFYPKLSTPVLKWHKSKSNTTTGITEPLLAEAIKLIIDYAPDIEILQNIALSIRNRDFSYRPDLVLFWQKFNLCIDIEIDEPYDMVSRKPLHYIGSSDYLRNLYFVSQGWVVIRFREEQMISNIADCVKYVASILKTITEETLFDSLIESFEPEYAQRWSYEQAKEFANDNYREKYLNIEAVEKIVNLNADFIDESPFIGIPPAEDILPEIDYSIFVNKLNDIHKKYIRVATNLFENQQILENYKCDKQLYKNGISGFDLVEEKNTFVPFEVIIDIEGMDSPYKYPLYNNSGNGIDDKLKELVIEAIYGCNPIRMEYQDRQAHITFRNITLTSFETDSQEYYGDKMWVNYYNEKSSMITAFCMLRNAQRHFYINRMRAIQVFDLKYFGIGHLISFSSALWYPLAKNDFQLCEHISKLIPKHLIETNLQVAGNFAHYLLLSERKNEAIEIYRKFDGQMVTKELGWREMNLQDFKDLKDISNYNEKFDEAIELLGWTS